MGFFFKKRIKFFPGCYINFSKGGVGFSFGPKGLKYSVNSKGEKYINGGSGGVYFREKIKDNTKEKNVNEVNPKNQETLKEDLDRSILLRANAMRLLEKQNAIKELEKQAILSPQESEALIEVLRKMN